MAYPERLLLRSPVLGFPLGWGVCLEKEVDGSAGNHPSVGFETRLHFQVVEIAVETL
jgi:hypothetical protein